jgi:hypothetical protein
VKKTATEAQIAQWTTDLVELERARLPSDHPRHHHIGGGYLSDIRQRAQRAEGYLSTRGVLPSRDEIRRLANGGVDIEAFRAHRDLVVEVDAMRLTLAHAHRLDLPNLAAVAGLLRPVVDRMQAALPAEEKSK